MPGVIAVLTGEDVAAAGLKPMPAAAPMKGRGGADQLPTPRAVLAQGRVRFVGEPVALVVAESAAQAQDAADAISIDYDDLPAVVDARAALKSGAPQLHQDIPGNLVLDFVGGDPAATDAAFARAARLDFIRVLPWDPAGAKAAANAGQPIGQAAPSSILHRGIAAAADALMPQPVAPSAPSWRRFLNVRTAR